MDSLAIVNETLIWPEICDALVSRYSILDAFSLNRYDNNMAILAGKLQAYQSHSFSNNERLIFTLYDTEYYHQSIGFTTTNLLAILYHLDISVDHCMFFTNHHGIADYIKQSCQSYKLTSPAVFENNFCIPQTRSFVQRDLRNPQDIKYHFGFLSHQPRDHRIYIRCFLEDRNLVEQTLLAWTPVGNPVRSRFNNNAKGEPVHVCTLIEPSPNIRIKNKIIPDTELAELYHRNKSCLNLAFRDPVIKNEANENNFDSEHLKYSFIEIAAETVYDYPYPYLTEKTFRCFWELSPFIIVGAPGSLAYIKSIGFRTFSQWFDESYDEIQDPVDRLKKIFSTLEIISKWSLAECQQVYNEMLETIVYNQTHFKEFYCKELLNQTISKL